MLKGLKDKLLDKQHKEYTVSLSIIFIISIILYNKFVSMSKVYIFNDTGSDTFDSYWPFIRSLLETIRNGELPFWSHNMGMGTSQYATNIFMGDPFIYLYLLFSIDLLPYLFGFMAILKINVTGYLFVKYLKYLNLKSFTIIVASILYALNGYIILWGQHYQFVNVIMFLPLLMLGFEKILREDKKIVMIIAICFLAINSYYFLYQISLFLILYATVRFLLVYSFEISRYLNILKQSLIAYMLGIGLSAIYLIPTITYVLNSPRISGNVSPNFFALNSLEYYFSLFSRGFSNNTLGIASSYVGTINYYESPILFSSILVILLIPASFISMTKRQRIINGLLFSLTVVFLILPFFATMFNAFSKIDYRWTYLIIFVNIYLITFSLEKIDEMKKNNIVSMIITYLVLIISYLIVMTQAGSIVTLQESTPKYLILTLTLTLIFGAMYIICFSALFFNKKNINKYLIVVILIFEVIVHNYPSINHRVLLTSGDVSQKVYYNDSTIEAINYLQEVDSNFYRIKKDYFSRFLNDPLMQGYNGITGYNSLHQFSTLNFLENMNIEMTSLNLIFGLENRINLEALIGVKYFLSKSEDLNMYGYKKLETIGDVTIYENLLYIPSVFTYNQYIKDSEFEKMDVTQKDSVILNSVVLSEKDIEGFNHLNIEVDEGALSSNKDNVQKVPLDNNGVRGENVDNLIVTGRNEIKFNSINEDPIIVIPLQNGENGQFNLDITIESSVDNEGQIFWNSTIQEFNENDSKKFPVLPGEHKYNLKLGNIDEIKEIRIDVARSQGSFTLKDITLSKIENDVDIERILNLQKSMSTFEFKGNNKVIGSIKSVEDEILYLSIPYDRGWKATVNGEKEEIFMGNYGFLAIPLKEGNNSFEIKYTPPNFYLGLLISLLTLLIIIFTRSLPSRKF